MLLTNNVVDKAFKCIPKKLCSYKNIGIQLILNKPDSNNYCLPTLNKIDHK